MQIEPGQTPQTSDTSKISRKTTRFFWIFFYVRLMNYIPRIGHSVAARPKVGSPELPRCIVGPVTQGGDNECVISFEVGTSGTWIEWRLGFDKWSFQFLHLTDS